MKLNKALSSWSQRTALSKLESQFYYGYRELILDYLGLDRINIILGSFQHGDGPKDWPNLFTPTPRVGLRRLPLYVSSSLAARSLENKSFPVHAIGSPILFASANLNRALPSGRETPKIKTSPDKVVIIPRHTHLINVSYNNVELKIKEFRKLAGSAEGTLLLYSVEFLSNAWRKCAAKYEFKVQCAGLGKTDPPYANIEQRTDFFLNLLLILDTADKVYIEGLSSAIHYSIFLNKDTKVILDSVSQQSLQEEDRTLLRWYKEFVPGLFEKKMAIDAIQRTMILENLGLNNFLDREQLKSLLNFVSLFDLLGPSVK